MLLAARNNGQWTDAQGYTLAIKLKSNIPEESQNDFLERLEKQVITKFSPCTLKDKRKVRL
jgi:hypothetical protein